MPRTTRRIAAIAALAAATMASAAPASAFEASSDEYRLSSEPEQTAYAKVTMSDILVSSIQGTAAGRVLETQALGLVVETDDRGNVSGNLIGTDALSAAEEEEAAGLLLPAVQRVREHAARLNCARALLVVISRVGANVDLDGDRIPDASIAETREGSEGFNGFAVDAASLPAAGARTAFSY